MEAPAVLDRRFRIASVTAPAVSVPLPSGANRSSTDAAVPIRIEALRMNPRALAPEARTRGGAAVLDRDARAGAEVAGGRAGAFAPRNRESSVARASGR
jgi:hypothetical protein